MPYGPQILWPDHCVQGTRGAQFHDDLDTTRADAILRKGQNPDIDSYSAFFENDHETRTGLDGYLRERGIDTLTMVGLATDFCVKWSAVDAAKLGYDVTVRTDLCRGIDLDGSLAAALAGDARGRREGRVSARSGRRDRGLPALCPTALPKPRPPMRPARWRGSAPARGCWSRGRRRGCACTTRAGPSTTLGREAARLAGAVAGGIL